MSTNLSFKARLAMVLVALTLAFAPLGMQIAARMVARETHRSQEVAVNWNTRQPPP